MSEPKGGDRKVWGCGAKKPIEALNGKVRGWLTFNHSCRLTKGHDDDHHKCGCGHEW